MRLRAHNRIIGTLAVALVAGALAPGASADYGVTHRKPLVWYSNLARARVPPRLCAKTQMSRHAVRLGGAADPGGGASGGARCDQAGRGATGSGALLQSPGGRSLQQRGLNAYATLAHPVAASAPTLTAPGDRFDYGAAAVGAGIAVTISR